MRAAILGSGMILGFMPFSLAMPVAAPPALPNAIQIHGCHHNYAHDMSGWHRHDKECRSLLGLVGRKNRPAVKG
jgi:hypothetical protein